MRPEIKLYPFQEECVKFFEEKDGKAMSASEMGLGKTIQGIAYTSRNNFKTLVICPAYLKYNWANEIKKFTYDTVDFLSADNVPTSQYVIINYEMIHTVVDIIPNMGFECAILDESQYMMNLKSKRTMITAPIVKQIPRRILLSGTPIKNKVIEYFSQVDIIKPGFCDKKVYNEKFVGKKINLKNHDVDTSKLKDLNLFLRDMVIRHRKKDVLKDLPDKVFQSVPIDLPGNILCPLKGITGLEYITRAKQLLSKAKIKECVNLIKDHIAQNSKVIVYSQHLENIHELYKNFESNAVLHYGGINSMQRQANVDRFQTDPNCNVLVGNIDTAVGYTATSADTVIFLDLPWSPSDLKQAEDRAHRIGQKNAVTVKYLIARGTLDEQILKLLQSKEKILLGSLDGKMSNESMDIKQELLESLNMEQPKVNTSRKSGWGRRA